MAWFGSRGRQAAERDRSEPPTCERCRRPLELGRLYDVRGWVGECSIALHGLPCLICPVDGHPKRWIQPGFADELRRALFRDGGAPVARPRRFRRARCVACGRPLRASAAERGTETTEVRVGEAAFTVEIAAPLVSCSRCDARQVPPDPEVRERLSEALERALSRAGLAGP